MTSIPHQDRRQQADSDDGPSRDLDRKPPGVGAQPEHSEHTPDRPSWDCRSCGKDWPCDPARERLTQEYDGSADLSALLWSYLEDYAIDSGPGPLAEAHERFLGWVRVPHTQDAP